MKKIPRPLIFLCKLLAITFFMSLCILQGRAQNITAGFNITDVSAIGAINDNASLRLYPNPAADEAKIVFNSSKYDVRYQARLINNAGVLLRNIEGITVQGQNTIKIHVGNYPPGVYYIQLLTPDGRTTLKLLKQPLNSL